MNGVIVLAVALVLAAGSLRPREPGAQAVADTSFVRGADDTGAQRLFGELMSPFCRGLTLAACPSPGADSLRQDIRTRLSGGETPRSITAAYARDWGEQMLGAPPVRDWGVLLWAIPGVALVGGAAGLSLWLRTLRRRSEATEDAQPSDSEGRQPVDPALRRRLDAELEAFARDV